jgi:hypothetical protein
MNIKILSRNICLETVAWVENATGRTLSQFEAEAVTLLAQGFDMGVYNLPVNWRNVTWGFGNGVCFPLRFPNLSTFDSSALTRLVILAHDECTRLEIDPLNFQHLALTMHPRAGREGNQFERHPSIEQAITTVRGAAA